MEALIITGITAAIQLYMAEVNAVSEKAAKENRALTDDEKAAIASGDVAQINRLHAWADKPTNP